MMILFGCNLSLHWGFFQFSSWIVDSKLTKPKDWSALCKLWMPVFITGDWKVFDVGKFSSVEMKSIGQAFQGDVCYKGSSGSGLVCAAGRLKEPLRAAVLALVLWGHRSSLMIWVATTPVSLFRTPFREFQFLAICGHQKTPQPTICGL